MYTVTHIVDRGKVFYIVLKDGKRTGWISPFKSEMDEMARVQNEKEEK